MPRWLTQLAIPTSISGAVTRRGFLSFGCAAGALYGAKRPANLMVPTLTGAVPCDNLGTTLIHEHVLYGEMPSDQRAASVDIAVKLLKDAARVGVDTLVDLSPTREMPLYQEIAKQVPLRIIASTGSYL